MRHVAASGPCGMSTGRRGGPGPVRGVALEASGMLSSALFSDHEGQFELHIASETGSVMSWPHVAGVSAGLGRTCASRLLDRLGVALKSSVLPSPNNAGTVIGFRAGWQC